MLDFQSGFPFTGYVPSYVPKAVIDHRPQGITVMVALANP